MGAWVAARDANDTDGKAIHKSQKDQGSWGNTAE